MEYKTIEDILESNKSHVDFEDYHITIDAKLQTMLYEFVEKIDMKDEDRKEFIKDELRDIFDLKENDIILLKKEHIFIKISNDKKVQNLDETETKIPERRFNGVDEDELKDFYHEFFSKKRVLAFLKRLLESL